MLNKWLLSCCSVAQPCPTVCQPMDCSMPGFPLLHFLPELGLNSCPLSLWCHPTVLSSEPPSPPALGTSQHEGLFQWVSYLYQVAEVLELQLQHPVNIQDWFPLGLTGLISLQSKRLSRVFWVKSMFTLWNKFKDSNSKTLSKFFKKTLLNSLLNLLNKLVHFLTS